MKRIFLFLSLCSAAMAQTIVSAPGVYNLSGGSGGGGSGTITSGTTNRIPKYTAATTIGNSLLSDDGTTLTYTGTGGLSLTGSPTAILTITGATSGSFVITGVDAMGQAGTLSLAAQTSGAATASVPDMAGSSVTVAFNELRQNSQSTAYAFVLEDAKSKHILHPAADNNARTFTIPANASVAFPIGATITVVNSINTLTIAITSDTLTWYAGAGTGSTGSRTIAAGSVITLLKIGSTSWIITGNGIT